MVAELTRTGDLAAAVRRGVAAGPRAVRFVGARGAQQAVR
jgi:hypothetical protein